MAKQKSTTSEKTNVRRIKASDDAPKKTVKGAVEPKAIKKTAEKVTKKPVKGKKLARDIDAPAGNPLIALGNYFRGAWHELRQVRWPTRSATWSMTLAVLLFSGIFVTIILLLDYGFNLLFERILN